MQGRQSKMDALLVTKIHHREKKKTHSHQCMHRTRVLSPAASNITPSLCSAVYEVSQQEGKTAYNVVSTRGIDHAFVYEG